MRFGPDRAAPGQSRWKSMPPGAPVLGLATLVAAASLTLALPNAHAIFCDRLAPLAVLAGLSATLIALGFRALASAPAGSRSVILCALLLAAVALFVSSRFVAKYHGVCSEVEQRLRQLKVARPTR